MSLRPPSPGRVVAGLLVAALVAGCSGAVSSSPPPATGGAAPAPVPGSGTAIIETSLGTITIQLYGGSAPIATANFVKLAQQHFYDRLTFHRLVPGFVIQGGDPNGDGSGGPGYTIKDEPVVGDYMRGAVAMARTAAPDSAGSQFFICLADLRARLPKSGGYVIFGQVTGGMDIVDRLAAMPNTGAPSNRALQPVSMTRVTIQP